MCAAAVHPLKRSDSKHSCATVTTIASGLTTSHCTLSQYSVSSATVALRNLIYLQEWADVVSICISNPHEAKVTDRMGDLPIHEACLHGAPFNVIESLLSAYPSGIQKKGFCGRLPLHYAVYNKPSLNTVQFLLEKYPAGASTIDADGRLPIHLAVIRNSPKDFIEALIAANPQSLQTPNKFGNTPEMLARNDYVYSVLNGRKDVQRTALHRANAKMKLPRTSQSSNSVKTKSRLITANTLRQNINKARRRSTSNGIIPKNAPPNKRQRQPRLSIAKNGTSNRKHVTPDKIDQMQLSELQNKAPEDNHKNLSDKTVQESRKSPSEENSVSKMIHKHESRITETRGRGGRRGTNRVKRRTLVYPVVAVT